MVRDLHLTVFLINAFDLARSAHGHTEKLCQSAQHALSWSIVRVEPSRFFAIARFTRAFRSTDNLIVRSGRSPQSSPLRGDRETRPPISPEFLDSVSRSIQNLEVVSRNPPRSLKPHDRGVTREQVQQEVYRRQAAAQSSMNGGSRGGSRGYGQGFDDGYDPRGGRMGTADAFERPEM